MLLILNHKANLTFEEIKKYEKSLRKYKVIIMPSNCYLSLFQNGKYILASQDISEFDDPNISGEINGRQLESLNVKYCLIGHSNRSIYLNETNEIKLKKIDECLKYNLIPLCCIGEKESINELDKQIDLYLNKLINQKFYIIYEPINNIGKNNPSLNNVEINIKYIKKYILEKYTIDVKIIYGGGVNLYDLNTLCNIKELEGLILCTCGLDIKNVKALIEKTN